ncbi:hypothetical protein DJ021_09725 [Phenylobacterium hankyongense]|uniref:YbjN domain-containing protein n=1 Tax=Phenylobacterium hankyongense TaxID=1813876 RepID=A0A328B2K2_9CAUL|nr:YbjN domain-containing protein [Phenylobacterium hankyongense]RAK60064.1 hypothetical protein DJ021_09725 [Phenylobacterium hankyongense]
MMLRKTLALIAAAVLCMGAAPAKPAPATAKPAAAKPAAAKPAAIGPKPAASTGAFDIRDPASLAALLTAAGAKAQPPRKDQDAVLVAVTSVAADFSIQFLGCDPQGRACKAAMFDHLSGPGTPTFAQLNAFSQTSATCRTYQDRSGKPHVVYSTLLFADDSRDHARTQLAAWQGCIAEFGEFLKDPNAYLASAP